MKKRSTPGWLKSLPVDPSKLTLEELRHFKRADEFLTEPIEGPEGFQYMYGCYKLLLAYSAVIYSENRFPAFNRCYDDLLKTFLDDESFEDDLFLLSWILCDFPIARGGTTVLETMEEYLNKEIPGHDFQYFIDEMRNSRMGLYQEIISTKKTMKFRELFTGDVVSTLRSVDEFDKGELFLARVVKCKGDAFLWGDPKCWPKSYIAQIEGMVDRKLFYFDGETKQDGYRKFMKLAGPYWFSCVATNKDIPILQPDHYLTYYQGT